MIGTKKLPSSVFSIYLYSRYIAEDATGAKRRLRGFCVFIVSRHGEILPMPAYI
jgi:hypothetical protein